MSACSPGAEPDVHIRDTPGIFVPSFLILSLLLCALKAHAQQPGPQEFPIGGLAGVDQLPASRLRTQLRSLPAPAQARALQWLQSFHFTETDLPSLHADRDGGIFYVCDALPVAPAQAEVPPIAAAAVPVSPFPGSLVFHSRPGAPNVLFLNFSGENVTSTEWNTSLSRTNIPAVAFSTDGDDSTFSDAEQVAIKRIWQRVAEDYAPFNVDVTTERPATFNSRTAHALITRSTDANGDDNPSSGAGGVAYINVFAGGSYARYRPAWVYYDNLASTESYIAEAASHEIGHNLGLSHDGLNGTSYYGGHGSGDISWGPIMGTGYNRNVSQWSKGDYYHANNTQDDLATIAGKIPYRADDHGNTAGAATALAFTGGTNVFSTTPENDPANTNTLNKGVFDHATDVDVFTFITGAGPISLSVRPWVSPSGTRGGNLDVLLELYNDAGTLISSNDPASQTIAQIQTTLAAGRYYLHVRNAGTGDPLVSSPTGYTPYGSLGQFFISGYITSSSPTPGQLAILPAGGLTSSGTVGGPFSPSSIVYTLTNSGGSSLNWTATKAQSWVTLSATSGTLSPGASTTVTLSINAGANSLVAGVHTDTVNFANTTTGNGNTSRPVSLTVNSIPGELVISPVNDFSVTGLEGGPFTPDLQIYYLTNAGGSDLDWTITKTANWLTLSSAQGSLAAGARTNIAVTLNENAGMLVPGAYNDVLEFTNVTTGAGTSRLVTLTVNATPGQLAILALTNLSATGAVGGPFSPSSATCLLTNIGGSSLDWAITTTADWLTLSGANGTLPPGVNTEITLALNDNAHGLPAGIFTNTIAVTNVTTAEGTNFLFTLTVTPPIVSLTATVNNPDWGTVSPSNATYPAGSTVEVVASPAIYYCLAEWTGDAVGTNNPLSVSLNTNLSVIAVFRELLTTNHPTPLWWLAAFGYTNNFETAVSAVGANGLPLWQSYIAGLDPSDPASQLRLIAHPANAAGDILSWNTVSDRLYTISSSTNLPGNFSPLPQASDLPSSIQRLTNSVPNPSTPRFYRLEVRQQRAPDPLFEYAIAASGFVDLGGSSLIDSFDSGDPNYSTDGRYDPAKRKDGGHIASGLTTNDAVIVGNARVAGVISIESGGTVSVGPNGSVGSLTWLNDPGRAGLIEPGHLREDMNFAFADATLPSPFGPVLPLGPGFVGTTNYTLLFGNGDYGMTSLVLSGSQRAAVTGNARVYVSGATRLSGSAYIYITPGAQLTWYTRGDVDLAGNGVVNAGNSTNFQLHGLPGCTSVLISQGSAFNGVIYAPRADVRVVASEDTVGAILGRTVRLTGGSAFHFDENLKRAGPFF